MSERLGLVALTPSQGAITAIAAAMGTWRGGYMPRNAPATTADVTYLAPYWLPRGAWLPFEMMGPFIGAQAYLPRLPPDEPRESERLWDECQKLCSAYL